MSMLLQTRFLSKVPLISFSESLFGPNGRYSTCAPANFQYHLKMPTNRNTLYGFRTFSSGKDLSAKTCVPCNSEDLRPMTEDAANNLIRQVPEWNLLNEDGMMKLSRSWKVKTFLKGLEFFQAIATVAEAQGHHPDLHLVGWNNVKIDIWTHSVGGLTENDFILAAKINGLDVHHLMSRRTAK